MKTKLKYHLLLIILALSFCMISCEKEELLPTTPDIEEPDPENLPTVRSDNEQTVFMYLPWSNNLTSYFYQNIEDLKSVIGKNILKNERMIVFMCTSPTKATLSELIYEEGKGGVQKTLKSYDFTTTDDSPQLAYTTAEGITSILEDVKDYSPANYYAMIIGCHGMGWIPVSSRRSRSLPAFKKHWENDNAPFLTRYFGGTQSQYQTDITTLAQGIANAGLKMEYILFDDCYMSTVEVAYDLKDVAHHLIGCTSEIMAYGMPYALIGPYLIGNIDYKSICDGFYDFYSTYDMPCGTIGVTDCSELDNLAAIMKKINQQYTFDSQLTGSLQRLDGYSPTLFFDYGDYVSKLCPDPYLLEQFNEQLERTVPFKQHTEYYYTMSGGGQKIKINTFSGITISDPSIHPDASMKKETAWYKATH